MSTIEPKKTQNIYTNETQVTKPKQVKQSMRLQFVNEDLEQAVKGVRKEMEKKKEQKRLTIKNPELDVADAVLFTETYRKKYIERLKEIEERRKEIGSRSLSKQISARLNRKIKGNIELRNKMELLKDLQENKILDRVQRLNKQKKYKQEQKLLHETSMDNIKMVRKTKKKIKNKQLKESRIVQEQSYKNLMYKNYITNKEKQEHHMLLKTKQQFMIRTHSSHNIRNRQLQSRLTRKTSECKIGSRNVQTSQNRRNKIRKEEGDYEDLMIDNVEQSDIKQRILNKGVRTPKQTDNKVEAENWVKESSKGSLIEEVQMEINI